MASPLLSSLGGSGAVLLGAQSLSITNAADTFSGTISGTGGLVVAGGTQTLAGTNSYSGATEVKSGILAVSGSITSSSGVTVDAGGTLAGSGTVPQLTVNGGSVAPGINGSGTLSVAGPVAFGSGSSFVINGSSASTPELAASGSASLNGTLAFASMDGTYPVGRKLTVLTATGGVSGSFAAGTLTAANGVQFSESVSTDANDVFLTVNLAKLSPALSSGASLNQANAIAGIDTAIAAGSSLPSAFGSLANLSSVSLTAGAQQLAGELGGDLAQADNAMIAPYENAVFNRLDGMVGIKRVRRALLQTRPQVWGALVGGTDVTAGTAADGSSKFSASAAALVAGVDWPVSSNLTLGGAVSFGSNHFHVEDGLGKGKSTAFQFGVYGAIQFTPRIYGAFLASFGQDAITTDRQLTVSGTDDLTASLTSQDFVARYETGVDLHWITPYAALGERLSLMPSYSETAASGSNNFALSYASNNLNRLDVELGFRNQADLPMNRNWTLHLSDKLAWQHAVFSSYEAPASYSALAGSQFTTYGAQPGKDLAVWSLGAGIKNRYGLDIGLQVDSSVSKHSQSYDGVGHIALNW